MDSFQIVVGVLLLSMLPQLTGITFSVNLVDNIRREFGIPWAVARGIFRCGVESYEQ